MRCSALWTLLIFRWILLRRLMARLAAYLGCSSWMITFRRVTTDLGEPVSLCDPPRDMQVRPLGRIAHTHTPLVNSSYTCPQHILPKLMRSCLCPRELIHCFSTRKSPPKKKKRLDLCCIPCQEGKTIRDISKTRKHSLGSKTGKPDVIKRYLSLPDMLQVNQRVEGTWGALS